jgi:regulator of sigma E protease
VNTALGIIVGIVGLGFLVLVHEFGHFIVAKATGMRVEEFSLGFGPYLIKKRWGETVYGISAVPLGGYVRVTGMHREEFEQRISDLREIEGEESALVAAKASQGDAGDEASLEATISEDRTAKRARRPRDPEDALAGKRALTADEIASTPLKRRYYSHPLWHKLLFIVAGVTMNMIVAFAMLYVVGVTHGDYWSPTVVGQVETGSSAALAGVQVGDRVVSVDGHVTNTWSEMAQEIVPRGGDTVVLVLARGVQLIEVETTIGKDKNGAGLLGVGSTIDARGEDWRATVVSQVTPGSNAARAGIQPGDRVLRVAGDEVESWGEVCLAILPRAGSTIAVELLRGGKPTEVDVEVGLGAEGVGQLGARPPTESLYTKVGLLGGFAYAGRETGSTVAFIFKGIGWMLSGAVPATGPGGLAGPVGIVQISADVVQGGYGQYLLFLALISINLALLNMLPLLPLDGGHFVYSLVERIRGRAISLKVFERVSFAGLALFAVLFVVAMYNDVGRIFSGF